MNVNLCTPLRGGAILFLLLAAFIASPAVAQSDWGTPAQEEALARARVDLRRSQIGLPPLALNAQLETAARGHASYLTINNLPNTGFPYTHFQDAAKFPNGFTGTNPSDRIKNAGYVGGAGSEVEVVVRGTFHGEDAVDGMIQAIYRRAVIFSTAFGEQGAGISQSSQGVTVINFGTQKAPLPAVPAGWVGVYPYAGQARIAVDFYSDEETPDPVPNLNRVGYPVSLHIADTRVLAVTSFTLAPVDAGGNASPNVLPVELLPQAGANACICMPASVAAIIPRVVLQYGTVYEAQFVGTADGQPLSKTWRFTTAPYAALAITGPATAYVGDTVALIFGGGSGRYVDVRSVDSTAAFTQSSLLPGDGVDFRADAPGTINVMVTDGEGATATLSLAIKSAAQKLLPFATGWNLVGNSTSVALDVATLFGNASGNAANVATVWKWLPATSRWAFYTPSLADGGAAFALSKSYDFLVTINPGDGFWVNAKAAFAVQLPVGAAVSSTSMRSTLAAGWNLVSVGDNRTPRGFNTVLGPPPAVSGEIPINLTTLWAWDVALTNWYFYSPSLDQSSGLASYILQKSYLDFSTKTLDPLTGFWVNRP